MTIVETNVDDLISDAFGSNDPDAAHYYCKACGDGDGEKALCGYRREPGRPRGPYRKKCATCKALYPGHLGRADHTINW